MSKRTDSNSYTMIFAIIMVLVVGSLLAFMASSLKPNIDENKRIEKQQNILYALGVNENEGTSANFISTDVAGAAFSEYITKQIEVQGGKEVENSDAYLIDIKKQQTLAKQGKQRRLPLFVGKNKNGDVLYVAPIRGKGLWDAIWGYVALDENMIVQGAYFDHKGETPGLGANIKQRYFMDDFIGEHLLSASGDFKGIRVAKGNNDPKNEDKTDYEVDAIAGATITGDGVSAMIKKDLAMYVPYFKTLKK
ncbi:Na+-transporting NADH:ubiquinone oxidoreductase subunit C [Polaribacter sp. Hel1_33_78]|jgi:Na+-transporting NADH:ubiquinone oxidoreductase subunit C|uniref:Na(+)-translocating NADH-quinone reductase subunit C n=1 Tax=unclassified Polaribacter TaxID=196858 RepID=UPI00052D4415|nr:MULTISPECIES: Na(+)-translocating NADH-quinone reductase subunit C [unclassified Polaribacter]MBT3547346.1 Na(+)-translocating NADH-quinone reductase subunit C [Flavobacterium sp.]KGL59545.1 Na(+)-translocating NADH-quinone reductase subunit C [Polaribacter sp. Hel1_33_49]MDG1195353.1 Na(+)-translocating NADH-quinone reductase subunit C [Polaribacter sp.]MDG1403068.1 Na(+)-translocating NADH-quinone reductase subunit C [Polaribacter sp.]MDG2437309.1 Na(+)-translocating NADH-quinone reductas